MPSSQWLPESPGCSPFALIELVAARLLPDVLVTAVVQVSFVELLLRESGWPEIFNAIVGTVAIDVVERFRTRPVMPGVNQSASRIELAIDFDAVVSIKISHASDSARSLLSVGVFPTKKAIGVVIEKLTQFGLAW